MSDRKFFFSWVMNVDVESNEYFILCWSLILPSEKRRELAWAVQFFRNTKLKILPWFHLISRNVFAVDGRVSRFLDFCVLRHRRLLSVLSGQVCPARCSFSNARSQQCHCIFQVWMFPSMLINYLVLRSGRLNCGPTCLTNCFFFSQTHLLLLGCSGDYFAGLFIQTEQRTTLCIWYGMCQMCQMRWTRRGGLSPLPSNNQAWFHYLKGACPLRGEPYGSDERYSSLRFLTYRSRLRHSRCYGHSARCASLRPSIVLRSLWRSRKQEGPKERDPSFEARSAL